MDPALIAAICTGIGGIITSYAALVRARHRGSAECEERLAAARLEAEQATAEIHDLRLRGSVDLVWLVGVAFFVAAVVLGSIALSHETTGPAGPAGPPGPAGQRGPAGATGAAGSSGSTSSGATTSSGTGPPGAAGSTGAAGAAGSSTVGPEGPQGPPGPAGATVAGPPGPAGTSGQPGARGAQGPRGAPGPTCPAGASLKLVTVKLDPGGTERVLVCVPRG